MEQLAARRAHNPKVIGSSPIPAINKGSKHFCLEPFLAFMYLVTRRKTLRKYI